MSIKLVQIPTYGNTTYVGKTIYWWSRQGWQK